MQVKIDKNQSQSKASAERASKYSSILDALQPVSRDEFERLKSQIRIMRILVALCLLITILSLVSSIVA